MLQLLFVLGVLVVAGCGDQHQTRPDAPGGQGGKGDAPIDAPVDAGAVSTDAGDPNLLSMQGVYGDFTNRTLPSDAIPYTVNYDLWADGATKRRWLILPPGSAPIDNSNQDRWIFPEGTRVVKEFTRDGLLVETRIVERVGGTSPTYSLRTYVWRADGVDADLTVDGATNVRGTAHVAPTGAQCTACHQGEVGKVLGFSAVQLSTAMLTMLSSTNKLSVPIPAGTTFGPTGATATVEALGYLHGNCGHCHNPNGIAGSFINMNLKLHAASTAATQEPGYLTTVNANVQFNGAGATKRVEPMNPANSAVLKRLSIRGTNQMPLIATETVDATGVTTVTTWINSL